MVCNLCPRLCNAERGNYSGEGFCGLGTLPKIGRIAPYYWEEPCVSGVRGSGAIFFSGCTMRCVFCQNFHISAHNNGKTITENKLADEFKLLENLGVHNINLISPTPYTEAIIKALDIYRPNIPIVYNCSGYENILTLKKLDGYIDVYLPDFKYSDDVLALKFSKVKNYTQTALTAIGEMLRQTGKAKFSKENIIIKGTIIRHLVLPNNTKNSIGVLDLLSNHFENFLISLMCQYIPFGKAKEIPKLNRVITKREYEKVKQRLFDLNLDGFVQDLSSADEKYIPVWDY